MTKIEREADLYYKREKEGLQRPLPSQLKNPVSCRVDSLVCSMPLGGDSYAGCDRGCIYCFCRELESTMYPAWYDDWTPDLIRPADLDVIKGMLKKAASRKHFKGPAIQSFRKRYPFTLGRKSEPFLNAEYRLRKTRDLLKLFLEYDYPVFIETQAHSRITGGYLKVMDTCCAIHSYCCGSSDQQSGS